MPDAVQSADRIMEQASEALADMHYLECESLCLDALAITRQQRDWQYYSRILLPLQESRRQRRMIAADGVIRLGCDDLSGEPSSWLADIEAGCIVVTAPHSPDVANQLLTSARKASKSIEVLFAENPTDAADWTIRSFAGPVVSCPMPAPHGSWLNKWVDGTVSPQSDSTGPKCPAEWFLDACEKLGDVAIRRVPLQCDPIVKIQTLESALLVMTDHEILHQQLAAAARDAC